MTNNAFISVAIILFALLQGISTRPAPAEEAPKGDNPTAKMFGSTVPSGGPATPASGNAGQIIVGPVYQAMDLNNQPILLRAVLGADGQPTIALSSSGYIGSSALATGPDGAPGTLSQKAVGHTPAAEESTPRTDAAKLESVALASSLSHKGRSKAMAQTPAI